MEKMKQRTKRTWAACLAALWLVLPAALQAQVHIGGNTDAVTGALLDLTTPEGSNLGLLPLNVSIEDINEIPDVFTNKASIIDGDLQGLIVYNTNGELADGTGLYVWDGEQWHRVAAAAPVVGVSVSPTSLTFTSTATQQLTATVSPSTATNKAVTWFSSNTAVATVSATGVVTPVAGGTATITVTTVDGGKEATCAVTVNIVRSGCSSTSYFTQNGIKYYYCGGKTRADCTKELRPNPNIQCLITNYTIVAYQADDYYWPMWVNGNSSGAYSRILVYYADGIWADNRVTPTQTNTTNSNSFGAWCFMK
ncbi:MAG: Ig-like domain-containing protein [Candidatus Symbiothrix sp.]|jgi:hypothetical protein|nr:Ig-like domain-containing protein [Candidatus Symbiothrix sp.]